MIESCVHDIVSFFGVGLSSKKIEGKQYCRKALLAIRKVVGAEKFMESVKAIPVAMTQSVIQKEVLKTSSKSSILSEECTGDGEMDKSKNKFSLKRRKLGLGSSQVEGECIVISSSNGSSGNNNKSRLTELFSKADLGIVDDEAVISCKRRNSGSRDSQQDAKKTPVAVSLTGITTGAATASAAANKKKGGIAAIVNIGFDNNDTGGFDF